MYLKILCIQKKKKKSGEDERGSENGLKTLRADRLPAANRKQWLHVRGKIPPRPHCELHGCTEPGQPKPRSAGREQVRAAPPSRPHRDRLLSSSPAPQRRAAPRCSLRGCRAPPCPPRAVGFPETLLGKIPLPASSQQSLLASAYREQGACARKGKDCAEQAPSLSLTAATPDPPAGAPFGNRDHPCPEQEPRCFPKLELFLSATNGTGNSCHPCLKIK